MSGSISAAARVLACRFVAKRFAATTPQVVQLEVLGMHCSACSTAVEASLGELPGVLHSSISLILRKANVRIDPSLVTHVRVADAGGHTGLRRCYSVKQ